MRVTMVIAGLRGGGAERVCVNLANAWVSKGWAVTVVTVTQHGSPPAYNIDPRVARSDIGWPRPARSDELEESVVAPVLRGLDKAGCRELMEEDLTLIAILRRTILATAPDVVVAHIDMTNVRVLAAMNETGVPVVACEHTDTSQVSIGRWQPAREALYRRANAVVGSHRVIADWLSRRGAAARTIPNPLLPPSTVPFKRTEGRRRVITLARLAAEKRLDMLVKAFATLQHEFPEWDLEIYGDGPCRWGLSSLAANMAPGRVHFRGFVNSDYASILAGAELYVSTSWVEGFGNAIWEAMACGIPVVAMDCGAPVRTLVRDGIDGLIVRTNGGAALVEALSSLMGDDAARNALAARAPEVVKRYPIERSLAAWDDLLLEVVGQPAV